MLSFVVAAAVAAGSALPPSLWQVPYPCGAAVIAENTVYANGGDSLVAFDGASGTVLWNRTNPAWTKLPLLYSPAVGAGLVAIGSYHNGGGNGGSVWVLSAAHGELLWNYSQFYWPVVTPSAITSTHVFVVAAYLYSFDSATGKYTWYFDGGDPLCPPAVTSDGTLVVAHDRFALRRKGRGLVKSTTDRDTYLSALNQKTGTFVWTKVLGTASNALLVSKPTLSTDGRVFVTYFDGSGNSYIGGVAAYNLTTGDLLWRQTALNQFPYVETTQSPMAAYLNAPAISSDQQVLIVLNTTAAVGLNCSTGDVIWQYGRSSSYMATWDGPPLVVDQSVYAWAGYGFGQTLYTFDTHTGEVLNTMAVQPGDGHFLGVVKAANGSNAALFSIMKDYTSRVLTAFAL